MRARRAFPDHQRGQGNVRGDHEVACANAPHDLAVCNIQAPADLDGVDET